MDRFVVEARVQVATSVHPKFPQVRVYLDASPLRLHISPARLHRITHIVAALSTAPDPTNGPSSSSSQSAGAGQGSASLPLWLTDAEYTAKVHVLSWEGSAVAGTRRAHWHTRYLHIWRGRVHLTREQSDTAPLLTMAYWRPGWRLVDIPPHTRGLSLGISAHCVALVPPGSPEDATPAQLASLPEALVLRPSSQAHSALHLALARSRATMVAVSGLGLLAEGGGTGGEEGEGGEGGGDVDVVADLLRHKQLLELRATLSELSVEILGRPPTLTLPSAMRADSLGAATPRAGTAAGEESGGPPLEEEASHEEIAHAGRGSGDGGSVAGNDAARGAAPGAEGGAAGRGQAAGGRDYGWGSITTKALAAAAAASATAAQGPERKESSGTGRARGLAALTELVDPEELRRAAADDARAASAAEALLAPAGAGSDGEEEGGEEAGGAWGQAPQLMSLGREVPLLLARFRAAVVDFVYSAQSMHVGAAMRALEIDDLLLGPRDSSMLPLARSGGQDAAEGAAAGAGSPAAGSGSRPAGPGDDEGNGTDEDEAFFDAQASWLVPPKEQGEDAGEEDAAAAAAAAAATAAKARDARDAAGQAQAHPQHLVWISFTSWDKDNPRRPGTDSELRVRLSRLTFRAHRPTVAALMALGLDFSLATDPLTPSPFSPATTSQREVAAPGGRTAQSGEEGGESDSESDVSSVAGDEARQVAAAGADGENRVMMRLVLEMEKLELVLPYEGGSYTPLASASMECFHMTIESRVVGLSLNARLGNIQAQYEALPQGCAHRTICALRPGGAGSLVELVFKILAPEEIAAEKRAPAGIRTLFCLEARVSAVQLVFLQRFMDELTDFMLVMVAMQPVPLDNPQGPSAPSAKNMQPSAAPSSTSTALDPLALLLDVQAAAPLVILPQSSTRCTTALNQMLKQDASSTSVELDLGSVSVSNVLMYRPVASPPGSRVNRMRPPHAFSALMDHINVHVSGMGMVVVGPGGARGKNLVSGREEGLSVDVSVASPVDLIVLPVSGTAAPLLARPRRHGPLPYLPPIQVRVEVSEVCVTLSDGEYCTMLAVMQSNFAEAVVLPPALSAFNATVLQKLKQEEEEEDDQALAADAGDATAAAAAARAPAPDSASLQSQPSQPGGTIAPTDAATAAGGGVSGPGGRQGSLGTSGMGMPAAGSSTGAAQGRPTPPPGWNDFGRTSGEVLGALGDRCAVMASVLLRRASVQLMADEPGTGNTAAQPLACISVADTWFSYVGSAVTNAQLITLVVPTLALQDLRPGAAPEAVLVLSTADPANSAASSGPAVSATSPALGLPLPPARGAAATTIAPPATQRSLRRLRTMEMEWEGQLTPSMLALEFRSIPCSGLALAAAAAAAASSAQLGDTPPLVSAPAPTPTSTTATEPALQAMKLRLQKPTLVLDLGFMMQLSAFVAPQPGGGSLLGGAAPQPFATRELSLGAAPHVATGDLWLSPEYRLLADAPDVSHFVYDGAGHRLVLPRGLPSGEALPLILVGPGKTLRLRNTVVVHSNSLGVCLQLGAGGRLLAREEDGCRLVTSSRLEEEYASYLTEHASGRAVGEGTAPGPSESPLRRTISGRRTSSLTRAYSHAPSARITRPSLAAAQPQQTTLPPMFELQLDASGVNLHILDCPVADATSGQGAAGLQWQGPAGSLEAAGRVKSAGSLSNLQGAPSLGRIKSEAHGLRVHATSRMLRRLALLLDVSASYKAVGTSQAVQASLRGLSIRTLTTLVTAGPVAAPSVVAPAPGQAGALLHVRTKSFSGMGSSGATSGCGQGAAGGAAQPPSSRSGSSSSHALSSSTVTCTVLEPCDITLAVKMKEPVAGAGEAAGSSRVTGEVEEGSNNGTGGQMDVSLDVSDVVLKLSPDVLQLVVALQALVSQPLVVPPPDKPLLRCDKFESLWSSRAGGTWGSSATLAGSSTPADSASAPPRATASSSGAGGLDPVAHLRGVSLWRPQAPQGYAILGDVAVPGAGAQPTAPVAVMAVNSGLVAWPLGYECCWSAAEGLALWWPQAPAGYVAMGCVASSGTDEPPPTKLVVCVAEHVVVEARVGPCMLLCAAGNLWGVSSCASTFVVAPPDSHLPITPLRDLRLPLGVPPAALVKDVPPPSSGVPPPPSLLAQKRYLSERAALLGQAVAQRSTATAVEFRRLWWDKHSSASPSVMRVSFWRPVPPPGYVALADCMVTGIYAPPQGALVMADVDPGGALQCQLHGTSGKPPLLARPIGYTLVWMDRQRQQLGDNRYLSLWHPVAPQGYCALGCVVGRGPLQPPTGIIRCVRVDAAFSVGLSRGAPAWINPPHRQRTALCGWIVDERLCSFVAVPLDDPLLKPPPPAPTASRGAGSAGAAAPPPAAARRLEGWRIKLDEDGDAADSSVGPNKGSVAGAGAAAGSTQAAQAQRQLSLEVRAGRMAVLLRSCARVPLMEIGASGVRFGCGSHGPLVTRGFVFATASVWSYQPLLAAWEPVLEPWQLLLHVDHNAGHRQRAGVSPGLWLKVTSTQGSVQTALSQAAMTALLGAADEWAGALAPPGAPGALSATPLAQLGDGRAVVAEVYNTLGVTAEMLIDHGDRQEVVLLPPGDRRRISQPLPMPPPGPLSSGDTAASLDGAGGGKGHGGSAPAPALPPLRLLVDILGARIAPEALAPLAPLLGAAGCELVCRVKVKGQASVLMPPQAWGLSTRALIPNPSTSHGPAAGFSVLPWRERFVLQLPLELVEQLLLPAPGDNQFAGNPLELELEIVAPAVEAATQVQPAGTDVAGDAGAANTLALAAYGAVPVSYDWMANQASLLNLSTKASGHTQHSGGGSSSTQADAAAMSQRASLMLQVPLQHGQGGASKDANSATGATGTSSSAVAVAAAAATASMLQVRLSLDLQQMEWVSESMARIMRLAGSGMAARGTAGQQRSAAAGRRALRLPPSEAWSPFTLSGLSTLGAMGMRSSAGSTVVPIPIAVDGLGPGHGQASGCVALESSMGVAGGWRCEVLRSMCTLHNTTSLTLQVSLLFGSDAATWTLIPHTSSGSLGSRASTPTRAGTHSSGASGAAAYEVVEEEVFENEQMSLKGWASATPAGSASLNGAGRHRYNRHRAAGQDSPAFPQVVLPPPEANGARWDWEGPWEVELAGHVDSEGWAYGNSWPDVDYPFKAGCGLQRPLQRARRRRWVRRRRCIPPTSHASSTQADGAVRKVLGLVEPGGALPLPLGWGVEGCELQVRPVLEDPRVMQPNEGEGSQDDEDGMEQQGRGGGGGSGDHVPAPLLLGPEGEVLHMWSAGTSGAAGSGLAAVDLSMVEDGATRLLSCACPQDAAQAVLQRPPSNAQQQQAQRHQQGGDGGGGGEASARLSQLLQPFWLSVSMESDPLVMAQGNRDTTEDWRLAVRSPLIVHNMLPVAAQFVVWERAGGPGARLRARQQGRLEPGASVPCYTADMRQQVLLTFCPDGCEYGEPEPVLVSEGIMARSLAGVAGSPRLPDSFRCAYTHSQSEGMALRVHILRELECTPGASGGDVPGGADTSAASLLGGPFTFSSGAYQTGVRPGTAVAEGVARGLPLAVRLYAPLVVLNATQLPISIGVVQVEVQEVGQGVDGGEGGGGPGAPPARSALGLPSSTGMEALSGPMGTARVIDTDAFTSAPKPPAHVTIMPRAVELLPLPALQQPEGGVVVQAAVALSIAGSRWSAPLPVAGPGGPPVRTASGPNPLDPVLIRARSRSDGTLQEVVVRLEVANAAADTRPDMGVGVGSSAGSSTGSSGSSWRPGSTVTGMGMAALAGRVSMVLHIEPHVVVVNRTGFTLNLVQPESMLMGGMGPSTPGTPLASGAAASTNVVSPAASQGMAGARAQGARPAMMGVPAGAVGLALQWHPSCSRRLLCVTMPGAVEGGEILVGEPFKLDALGVNIDTQVTVPLARTNPRGGAAPAVPPGSSSSMSDRDAGHSGGTAGGAAPASGLTRHTSPGHTAGAAVPGAAPAESAYDAAVRRARALLAAAAAGYGTAAPGALAAGSTDGAQPQETAGLCLLRVVGRDTLLTATNDASGAAGSQQRAECAAVVVCASVVARAPGCYALVLASLGAEPGVLLHNATGFGVRYRELAARGVWHTLGPFSAIGYVRQALLVPALAGGMHAQQSLAGSSLGPLELELRDDAADATGGTSYISFDPSADGSGEGVQGQASTPRAAATGGQSGAGAAGPAATGTAVLRLGPERADCMAQVTDALECVLTPSGLAFVDGGSTRSVALGGGGSRADRVMRVVPRPPAAVIGPNGLRATAPRMLVLTPDLVTAGTASSVHVAIEVSGLELSLVDGRPQELLVLSLEGLSAEYHAGSTAGVAYVQTSLKLRNLQVDDQLPGTPHPVVLLPLDANRQDGPGAEPLISASYTAEPGRRRGVLYCPCIAARVAPLRLALGEALLWRLFTFANALGNAAAASSSGPGTAGVAHGDAAHRPGTEHQQVVADLPLAIDLFNIEDVLLRISFKADAAVRPRFANQALSLGLDLAGLEDLPLVLPGMELERCRVRRDALVAMMLGRLQQKVFGIAISVLRNSGIFGSTSKILAAASHGVAALTEARTGTGREVGNLAEGVLEGGREMARGLLAGAFGIVAKPVQGAERGGVAGFLGGVAKGIVGAAVNPVSGALAAASKVTEGMDATYGRVRETVFSAPRRSGRKRLPRPFTGDRVLRPFSLHQALGQALLHTSAPPSAGGSVLTLGLDRRLLGRVTGAGSSSAAAAAGAVFKGDAYEEHYLLPNARVCLITDKRLALLSAPEFVALQAGAMGGDVTHITQVPPSTILWSLAWGEMLTAELAWHQQQPGLPPDGVLVHRKRRSAQDELVYDVRCRPGSAQAAQLLGSINAVRYRQAALRQEVALWRDVRAARGGGGASSASGLVAVDGQARPDTLPSCDWQLVWYCTPMSRPPGLTVRGAATSMSIWRPLGPPGYAALGDVAVGGLQPPAQPVRMYKDLALSDGDAPGEGRRLVAPVGYALVFRDSGEPPLTLWRPVAPRGYAEVGCVAWPRVEEPPLGAVRCVRRDLLRPAATQPAPLWAAASTDNKFWRVSVWPLTDSPAATFAALKGDAKPAPHQTLAPMY